MIIKLRNCANCATFNLSPAADEPLCWNLLPIDQADVEAGGVCDDHLTCEEDAEESAMCDSYRNLGRDWEMLGYLDARRAARLAIRKAEGQA
jgi:hypothetical protein